MKWPLSLLNRQCTQKYFSCHLASLADTQKKTDKWSELIRAKWLVKHHPNRGPREGPGVYSIYLVFLGGGGGVGGGGCKFSVLIDLVRGGSIFSLCRIAREAAPFDFLLEF